MKTAPQIGGGQFFLIIFLSRVVLTLTYSIGSGGHTVNNADWLAALFMPLVLLLIAIPTFFFLKQSSNQDVCTYAYRLHRWLGIGVSIGYALLFFILAYTPVARFSFFVTSAMQPNKNPWFFPVLIFGAVCFAAHKGLKAIVRTGAILSVIGVIAIVSIVVALIPRFDGLNIYTPIYDGWREVGNSMLLMLSNSLELSMFLMLAPNVKGNLKKAYWGYALLTPLMLFLVLFTVVAVLGEYANLQLFPFYSVAGIAKLGELTNLSALEASVWIAGVFIKSSIYLYLCKQCLKPIFPCAWHRFLLPVLGVGGVIAAAFSSENVRRAQLNFSVGGTLLIGFVFIVFLPLLLAVIGGLKKKVYYEKTVEPAS